MTQHPDLTLYPHEEIKINLVLESKRNELFTHNDADREESTSV